jgi:excisionase family DNA binding protein
MHNPATRFNPMTAALPRGVLSIAETAEHFACSVSTVRGLIRDRQIPHVAFGRRITIRREDAAAFLERRAAESVAGTSTPVAPAIVAPAQTTTAAEGKASP